MGSAARVWATQESTCACGGVRGCVVRRDSRVCVCVLCDRAGKEEMSRKEKERKEKEGGVREGKGKRRMGGQTQGGVRYGRRRKGARMRVKRDTNEGQQR